MRVLNASAQAFRMKWLLKKLHKGPLCNKRVPCWDVKLRLFGSALLSPCCIFLQGRLWIRSRFFCFVYPVTISASFSFVFHCFLSWSSCQSPGVRWDHLPWFYWVNVGILNCLWSLTLPVLFALFPWVWTPRISRSYLVCLVASNLVSLKCCNMTKGEQVDTLPVFQPFSPFFSGNQLLSPSGFGQQLPHSLGGGQQPPAKPSCRAG